MAGCSGLWGQGLSQRQSPRSALEDRLSRSCSQVLQCAQPELPLQPLSWPVSLIRHWPRLEPGFIWNTQFRSVNRGGHKAHCRALPALQYRDRGVAAPGAERVPAEGRLGCAAARNATGCAGVRETPRVGAAPGPTAACLGFHWSRGGAGRGANMTLKILIEMKRCSEGAHSSAHSARPAGLTASAAAARPQPRPRLREMLPHSPAVPTRAAGGLRLCESKGSASGVDCFCAFISNNEPEGGSKASAGSRRRWAA